jgi:hypothetical protein
MELVLVVVVLLLQLLPRVGLWQTLLQSQVVAEGVVVVVAKG